MKGLCHAECDLAQVRKTIARLRERYPALKTAVIGKSVGGREITALQIGRARSYVLYAGAFHGTERITAALLLRYVEALLRAQASDSRLCGFSVEQLLSAHGLLVVPMVNPDGCDIAIHGAAGAGFSPIALHAICDGDYTHYSANLRGVDINHNFDAGWAELHRKEQQAGIYAPAPRRYGGEKPMSEPETLAIAELCRKMPISHAVAFHSQGEVIYWDYGAHTPKNARKMAQAMAASSGYMLDQPDGIAVGGGFKDWFIEKLHRPAFTVEVGRGKNPLDPNAVDAIFDRLCEMMTLCLMM